jgi:CHAT domain-containing protein
VTAADQLARTWMALPAADWAAWWQQAAAGLPTSALAWALKRLSDAAWTTDPPATAAVADRAEWLAAQAGGAEVDALAAWTRGIALLAQGSMEAALVAVDRAGNGFAAIGRPQERAQTQISRLMALAMLGRYDEAVRCGEQARDVFDAAGDARAAGKIELNLGNLAARRDHHAAAAAHYGQARARLAAAADAELEVMAIKGQADMLARQHHFEQAEALFDQAQAGAAAGGLALLSAAIEADRGALELRRGAYDRALRLLESASRAYAALAMPHRQAVAEEALADAYLELQLLPEALALYDRSLATYEAAGLVSDRAWALSQRGRALSLLGHHREAAQSLAQAGAAFAAEGNPSGTARVQLWLAELAQRRGDWPEATRQAAGAAAGLLAARQTGEHLHARALLGEALRAAGHLAQAEDVARATSEQADAAALPPAQRRCRVLLGLLARDRGDAVEAQRCFEAAVVSIESQRGSLPGEEFRAAFLGNNLQPYHELVRASLSANGPDAASDALHGVERARARSLADTVEPLRRDGGAVEHDEVAGLRLRLNDRYRELSRPALDPGSHAEAQLLADARRIEALLLESDRRGAVATPRPAAASDGGSAFDLPALHALLGDHSALVEYFALDDTLFAFVVADASVAVVRLEAGLSRVQRQLEQLHFQTATFRGGPARLAHRLPELRQRALHHLQGLHAALWAPLAAQLGSRRVAVVPSGALNTLPFEALHDGHQHEVERREICRAPSAAVLLRCAARQGRSFDTACVMGHAGERLPHVAAEVQAVAALFAGAQPLLGDHAGAAALRSAAAGSAGVLHIACHAHFRSDNPRFSALHLADGAFTARDVARLRLGCSLVALSGCETAAGAVLPGDEVVGLSGAFLSAGAARVLASLWTVQDEAAAGFMQEFYGRLRATGQPARSLRETQRALLHSHPHPYFWAAFTLQGGW